MRRRRRPALVTLLTRVGCPTCAAAEPLVARLAAEAGVPHEIRDVDASPADRAAYGDMVPVVLIDGAEHAYWWVDEEKLRKALRG